ncbi:MAG: EAL domain-containing protein [Methylococcaceae bacterium]
MMRYLLSQCRAWLFGSLQRQLALSFGSVMLLMLLSLTGLLLKQQQQFLDTASIRRANALASGLADSSSSWVLANDVVGLNEILQGYVDTPNLEQAFILNLQGEVLAATHNEIVGQFVSDPRSQNLLTEAPKALVLVANDSLIDVAAPVLVGKRHVAWVRVELNQQDTRDNLQAVLHSSLEFTFVTALIILILATLLAKSMSKRLQQLTSIACKIAAGERNVRADVQHHDEISLLANNVNQMLDSLSYSEQKLDRLNRVYAAWTESVANIVREKDENALLNRICHILAEKIAFRLVLVGLVDDNNDWINIIASSNWQLPYLTELKISANPTRPEAQGPLGQAVYQQSAQIFNDFLANPHTALWHEAARNNGIRAVAAFPLTRSGKVIGGLTVYSQEVNYFTEDIIALLSGLTADVSFALDNFDHERQRQQAEIELALAASVFENSQEGIFITDANKLIVRVNTAFSVLTSYKADDVIGAPPHMLVSSQYSELFYQIMWQKVEHSGYWQGEFINQRKDGSTYTEWLTIKRVLDKQGCTTHYVGTFIDITEQKLNEERVHHLAFYDPLTQLPNRRLLVERLGQALLNSQRSLHYGALMFMDIDRFKMLNDTQGHNLGDQLLIEVGKRISHCVREQDTVARFGGDEFVLLLENLSDKAPIAAMTAQHIANTILQTLSEPYLLYHNEQLPVEYYVTVSIGMKLFRSTQINSEDLLKQADMAMYQAKHAGRNTLCVFDPEMQSSLNQRASLEADMRQAIQDGQFYLHYQVQVDKHQGVVGAEVLLRWQHPQRGIISPTEFIPLAEESGLIISLGIWTINEACQTLARWAKQSQTQHLTLAVNVSAKQFNRADFVDQIKQILDKTHINPARLKLEITESIILINVERIIETMNALRKLNVHFSMDDFGTGYSSLSYLQRLPLSQLKIDKSFVQDLTGDNNDAAIIRTILALGKNLNINVVAEGVETQQQYDYLIQNECDLFQGYLFGKPESLSSFEQRFFAN